jgi:CRP-like cAMP-binding protein
MLLACLRRVVVEEKDAVMLQDEPADHICFIHKGEADIYVHGELKGFVGEGDVIGQASILTNQVRRYIYDMPV